MKTLLALLLLSTPALAQDWDISRPFGPTTPLDFTTDEGTWMSVDIHPDGKTLIFDLLGDLYTLPIEGGKATRVTEGGAYDFQPRFSPDGKRILFTTDRGAMNNVWTADVEAGQLKNFRAITEEKQTRTDGGEWDPSGQWIIVRKRTTDTSSLGVSELWTYHANGGAGLALTDKKAVQEVDFPNATRDGRYLYFAAAPGFSYARNPHGPIWSIQRLDRENGQVREINSGFGSSAAPVLSPDEKRIAFVRREGATTSLWIHSLETGGELRIFDGLDRDQIEAFATHGAYPFYCWTPDGESIVAWAKGKLVRIHVRSGKAFPIPFSADVKQLVHDAVRFPQELAPDSIRARIIRWPVISPKEPLLLFSAFGHLYRMELPAGKPARVTALEAFEFAPAFSADGRWALFTTWDEDRGGTVEKLEVATGAITRLHATACQVLNPAFSPDGATVAFVQGGGANLRGFDLGSEVRMDLFTVDAAGRTTPALVTSTTNRGSHVRVTRATFSPDGARLYFIEEEESGEQTRGLRTPPKTVLCSVKLDGTDRRVHLRADFTQEIVPNPSATHVAFTRLHNTYVCPFPRTGQTVELSTADGALPFRQCSLDGGEWPAWSGDSTLTWAFGPEVFRVSLDKAALSPKATERPKRERPRSELTITEKDEYLFAGTTLALPALQEALAAELAKIDPPEIRITLHPKSSRGAWTALEKWLTEKKAAWSIVPDEPKKEEAPAFAPEMFSIDLTLPRSVPTGTLALVGARLITMRGDEVIENGTVVVVNDRIAAVGPRDKVVVPAGARVVDVAGKTIIPGLVDTHAHLHYGTLDVTPRREWSYHANLAYGVTTIHDPSASTHTVFGQGELVAAGLMTGPRIYSTGFILYGALTIDMAPINSYEDALSHVRRLKKQGAISVKSYMQPRRDQRQWVIKACREEGLLDVPEGGGDLENNLSMILDGHTTIEHALVVAPIYKDVITLFARSRTAYTPTLLVAYGGNFGHNWFAQHHEVWKQERLQRFFPARHLEAEFRRRPMAAEDDFNFKRVAEGCRQVDAAGGIVTLGAHGQLQGLGAHWELWSFGLGGVAPQAALKIATINGARALGMERQIGSIEAGKLADLVVLAKNPLEKLENSDSVAWTVANGVLYDAATMDRVWPSPQPRGRFPHQMTAGPDHR